MRIITLLLLLFSTAAVADEFRCPGTDPFFFEEMDKNGWVGFGETWDLSQCNQGNSVYAENDKHHWAAFRLRMVAPIDEKDVAFYSVAFPILAFGSIGMIFVLAWLLAFIQRRRRVKMKVVFCTGCPYEMVMPESMTKTDSGFCPSCGDGCQMRDL